MKHRLFSIVLASFSLIGLTQTPSEPKANTLDYDYLLKFFSSYVLAGRYIGNDPVTPTWVVGDKYHAAGLELYGK